MSIRVLTKVWEIETISLSEKMVLLALADYANDDGACWPSYSRIARKSNISKRTAIRIVERFVKLGVIYKELQITDMNGYASNRYVIDIEKLDQVDFLQQELEEDDTEIEINNTKYVPLESDKIDKNEENDTTPLVTSGVTSLVTSGDTSPSDKSSSIYNEEPSDITVNEPSKTFDRNFENQETEFSESDPPEPEPSKPKKKSIDPSIKKIIDEKFKEFWKLYPRKVSPKVCKPIFENYVKNKLEIADEIIAGLRAHIPIYANREKKFIPHPKTWLNQARWEDDISLENDNDPTPSKPTRYKSKADRLWELCTTS